ncbi:hypothetical protein [Sodalis sp. RH16]
MAAVSAGLVSVLELWAEVRVVADFLKAVLEVTVPHRAQILQ